MAVKNAQTSRLVNSVQRSTNSIQLRMNAPAAKPLSSCSCRRMGCVSSTPAASMATTTMRTECRGRHARYVTRPTITGMSISHASADPATSPIMTTTPPSAYRSAATATPPTASATTTTQPTGMAVPTSARSKPTGGASSMRRRRGCPPACPSSP